MSDIDTFFKENQIYLDGLQRILSGFNIEMKFTGHYVEALTHRSAVSEFCRKHKISSTSVPWNEKLEFLGDAVLGFVISSELWSRPEANSEGTLSKLKSALVSETSLASLACEIGLEKALILGKGEERSRQEKRPALLADALEALIGAVYLDQGTENAKRFVCKLYEKILLEDLSSRLEKDYKTLFQEIVQSKVQTTPTYKVVQQSGPDHEKMFVTACFVGEKKVSVGQGANKKISSQNAAKNAFELYRQGDLRF